MKLLTLSILGNMVLAGMNAASADDSILETLNKKDVKTDAIKVKKEVADHLVKPNKGGIKEENKNLTTASTQKRSENEKGEEKKQGSNDLLSDLDSDEILELQNLDKDTGNKENRSQAKTHYGIGYEYRMQLLSNKAKQVVRSEKVQRAVRVDRPEKVQRPDKVDRPEKIDRPVRIDRPTRIDRPDRPHRPERHGR